jgi:hypothetical protein
MRRLRAENKRLKERIDLLNAKESSDSEEDEEED